MPAGNFSGCERMGPVQQEGGDCPEHDGSGRASRALWISTGVTVALGIVEVVFWLFSKNNLFLIEGAGNLAWLVPDLIMLATVRVGTRKPDRTMNYGYRRIETVFLLFFSLGIGWFVISLLEKTLAGSAETLDPGYGGATVVLALLLIIVLGLLYRHLRRVGKETKSRVVLMDSMVVWMDMASAGVLLLSGIFLILMPSVHFIQLVLTLIVGFSLLAYCLQEASAAVKELIDANPSLAVLDLIEKISHETPDVRSVSDQRIRSFGGAITVDITVVTDPCMTVEEAYRLSTGLEDRIRSQVENVLEARVRVQPDGVSGARKEGKP